MRCPFFVGWMDPPGHTVCIGGEGAAHRFRPEPRQTIPRRLGLLPDGGARFKYTSASGRAEGFIKYSCGINASAIEFMDAPLSFFLRTAIVRLGT